MTDKSQAISATLVGAILGGVAAYVFFTDPGRSLRRRLEPALDEFAKELASFRITLQEASGVANEARGLFHEAFGDGGRQSPRYPTPQQSSPF